VHSVKLSLDELRALATSAGFGDASDVAAAVALAESGGDPNIIGDNGTSIGLWQIHVPAHPEADVNRLTDPAYNAQIAKSTYDASKRTGRDGFQSWSAYTNGRYKQYLVRCFSDALLASARADLGSLATFGIPGLFCAAAVQEWMRRAALRVGGKMPIQGSASARQTQSQLQAAGFWIAADAARVDAANSVLPGELVIWSRGPSSASGHIGVVDAPASGDGTFGTIEANAGPVVARYRRRLDADTLLGFGAFPCGPSTPRPAWAAPALIVSGLFVAAATAVGVYYGSER
jgi:hypothetical protein